MLGKKIGDIFYKAQQSSSCHQKCRELMRKLYNEGDVEDFEVAFMRRLELLFSQEVLHKNEYIERSLEFAATFVTSFVAPVTNGSDGNNTEESDDSTDQTHPFLIAIIRNTLLYHNLDFVNVRYRSCQFVNLIISNLGLDVHIENDLWNVILDSLLQRIKDVKPTVRLQAVKALARLQSPTQPDCPVIQAFLGRMYDMSSMVRKEMVELLAPCYIMSAKVVEKVRDSDYTVRMAAFRKCSHMGPKLMKVIHRQSVIMSGFNESHESVKRVFLENTLPKWLSAYDGNFLKFLYAIKLDGYDEDIKRTEHICKNVLEVFFKTYQLSTIVEYLPIDDTKVIPVDKLNYESALYWSILVNYLYKSDKTEEYLDHIIPELVHFCIYIERIVKNPRGMDGWKYVEYQNILGQLFQIVKRYDLGDEVGRQTLRSLIVHMFTTTKLDTLVITEMICILEKMNPVLDALTIDICSIISDIREPLVVQPPPRETVTQHNFKLAQFRVKINELEDKRDDAVAKSDYETAAIAKKELGELYSKVAGITEEFESAKNTVTVRTSQNDPETLCRCLNILIGILSHPKLKTLTTSLRSCRDEFVLPLMENTNPEIHWRVYKCIALYCVLDLQIARQSLKLICSPLVFYRLTPHDDDVKAILLVSIGAVTDLLQLFGPDVFVNGNDSNASNTTRQFNGTKRLYTIEQLDDMEQFDFQSITCADVIEILIDMLDDERGDVREQACVSLCNLVKAQVALSPTVLAKLVLTWFNPLTEKCHPKMQQLLGNTFIYFANMDNNEQLLEQMIIPILSHLGNAPRSSPLVDVDVDNALRFLAAITSIQKPNELVNIHKNLAYALCHKIAARPDDKCVPIYIKMLLNLDLFVEDSVSMKELISQAELILEEVVDKAPKRNIQKFVGKLKVMLIETVNGDENETVGCPSETTSTDSVAVSERRSQVSVLQSSNIVNNGPVENQVRTRKSLDNNRNSGKNVNPSDEGAEILHNGSNCGRKLDSVKTKNSNNEESIRQSTVRLSKVNLNDESTDNGQLKRRKQRGRRSKGSSIGSNNSNDTILHTIIENDEIGMGSLEEDDMTIHTPSTDSPLNSSTSSGGRSRGRPRKVVVSETSSDSDAPLTKSLRRSIRKRKPPPKLI